MQEELPTFVSESSQNQHKKGSFADSRLNIAPLSGTSGFYMTILVRPCLALVARTWLRVEPSRHGSKSAKTAAASVGTAQGEVPLRHENKEWRAHAARPRILSAENIHA